MGGTSGDGTLPSNTEAIDVSRTVQSSDLFTPYRDPRVTLPTIGSYRQSVLPFGGKYWGGPLTEYGGIGGLVFIGRQRVRDLEVTRSHRHYGSGFSKYLTDIQSHRRTELHLSECRLNDEILPAPLQADISKLNWQRTDPWPDSQAYGTHRPIFEVFPSVKPEPPASDKEAPHNTRSLSAQPLQKTTQNGLQDVNKKLYERTLYLDSYPGYSAQHLSQSMATQPGGDETSCSKEGAAGENEVDDDGETDEEEDEDSPAEETEELEDPTTSILKNDTKRQSSIPSVSKKSGKSVTFNDTPQIMEDTIRHFRIMPNRPMAGVGPCWPPGSSYVIDDINGTQLVERADIVQPQAVFHGPTRPKEERKSRRILSARARLARRFGNIIAGTPSGVGAPTLVSTLKSQNEFLRQRMKPLNDPVSTQQLPSNQEHQPISASTNQALRENFKLPSVQKIQSADQSPFIVPPCFRRASLVLPPAPLGDCLSTTGSRIPHRLGLRFMTEAHKRYHLMYPDDIPDLRTNRKDGKKYFFFNFHSSVFRG